MKPIDYLAFACALLSLLVFVWSSGSFQEGRPLSGTLKLLFGVVALTLGVGAGAASIGTDGYLPLTEESTLAATAIVTALAGDSLTARVTWPDGVTRTFRVSGVRIRFDARVLRWKIGGALLGAEQSWEFSGLSALSRDGGVAVGSARNVQRSRPLTVFDVVRRYPVLSTFVDLEELSVEAPASGNEIELRVSSAGLSAGN
jgi:hypothetical protein